MARFGRHMPRVRPWRGTSQAERKSPRHEDADSHDKERDPAWGPQASAHPPQQAATLKPHQLKECWIKHILNLTANPRKSRCSPERIPVGRAGVKGTGIPARFAASMLRMKPQPPRALPPKPRRPGPSSTPHAGPRTDWTQAAEWYDGLVGESGSEYHREVVLPGARRLLGLRPGDKAVDVACGQGVLCRTLHEQGVEVTGVDAAEPLIRAARERGPASIRYHVGDARDLSFLPAGYFSAAACLLAIQNIHPIAPVLASAHRLLKPGGRFVLVMTHPAFRGPKETSWGWDESKNVQYRRVDRYLLPRKSPMFTHPGMPRSNTRGHFISRWKRMSAPSETQGC